jgi:hypothetical protein
LGLWLTDTFAIILFGVDWNLQGDEINFWMNPKKIMITKMTVLKDDQVENKNSITKGKRNLKQLYGFLFGCAAGLVYGCITWMPDAIRLAQAHTALPWLKFFIGTPISILLFFLAGAIAIRKDSLLITMLCFGSAAVLIAILSGHLPYEITGQALGLVDPALSKMVSLPFHEGALTRIALTAILNLVVVLFASFFFEYSVSQSYLANSLIGVVTPLLIFILFFGVNGYVANDLINKPFAAPIQNMNSLIHQAQDIQSGRLQLKPGFQSWANTVLALEIDIQVPYRILVEKYDTTFIQLQLLVQFDQTWYRCFMMGDQPFFCDRYTSQ